MEGKRKGEFHAYIFGAAILSASRGEHVRLLANYLNIAAAGCAVGVVVTLPLAGMSNGQLTPLQEISLEMIFAGVSGLLAGAAHIVLWRFG